jgi:hypothetical protein
MEERQMIRALTLKEKTWWRGIILGWVILLGYANFTKSEHNTNFTDGFQSNVSSETKPAGE